MLGWFLSASAPKKKPRAVRAQRGKKGVEERRWTVAHTKAMLNSMGWVLLLGGVVGGWVWGEPYLMRTVAEHRAQPPKLAEMRFEKWFPAAAADRIYREAFSQLSDDPFDQRALTNAANAVAANPWVSRVNRVVRRADGTVEVDAEYRVPHALIEHGGEYHLIDVNGVRLPAKYSRTEAARSGLMFITGVADGPPPAGEVWRGDDARDALLLARLIHDRSWASQVSAIDAANYGARLDRRMPQMKLITMLDDDGNPANNPGVYWGMPPGREAFYEPHAAVKLAHIDRIAQRYGSVDGMGRIADVSTDQVLFHTLAPAEARADSRMFD